MKKKTTGELISSLRKENGMTQLQLAEKMCVTDKAVSKWERDLSYPDTSSIPKLAEVLGTTVEELLSGKESENEDPRKEKFQKIFSLVLSAIPLAMAIGVVILSILDQLDVADGMTMLGVGLFCLALDRIQSNDEVND